MSITSRKAISWLAALLVLALLAVGAMRLMSARKAAGQPPAGTASSRDLGLVELAPTDVVKARMLEVAQGLPISGTLKAVNAAVVKARVAGELQGLTAREGDFVKAGQVLAQIDATEYRSRVQQAQSQADSAKAQVEIAQRQYDNNKALVDQGFISRTGLDTSLANLNAARATYNAARAATDVTSKSVADTVVRAPISGQIAQRLAQSGERVGIDSRIVEIVDVTRLELEATLSPAESLQVEVGQSAELRIEGSPTVVKARVARINPTAQAGSRSVLAYLAIDASDAGNGAAGATVPLRQGLFAQGTLGTVRTSLLAVPLASVRTDKPVPYVQVVENSMIVHRKVEPGARGTADGETVVAVQGLSEGSLVVRANVGTLREGAPVRFTSYTGQATPSAGGGSASGAPGAGPTTGAKSSL